MREKNYIENLAQWDKIETYSRWMYSNYEKFIGNRVLDIGAGIGNMTAFYVDSVKLAVATDIFPEQLTIINERFQDKPNFTSFILDLTKPDLAAVREYCFDTIICINVLEHIEDDLSALENMRDMLDDKGRVVLVVPAHMALYNHMDEYTGHYRRYNKGELAKLAQAAGMKVIYSRHFNLLGIPVYYVKGKTSGKKNRNSSFSMTITESSSKLYNFATFFLKPLESIFRVPAGISEIMVLEK